MSIVENKYLNEREVSQLTGLALSSLRNHRHLGKGIRYSKIYRSVRYSMKDVIEFMEAGKVRFSDESK
jgi:predicted DNA-binding transcriptional regulator AlpA